MKKANELKNIKEIEINNIEDEEEEDITPKKKRLPLIINIFKKIIKRNENIEIKALCLTKILSEPNPEINQLKIVIGEKTYPIDFRMNKGIKFIKGYTLNLYSFKLPLKDILTIDIQNKIKVEYKDFDHGRIVYNAFDLLKGKNRNSKVIKYKNKSIYLRQTKKNTMYLTVRESNIYDETKNKLRIALARFLSFCNFKKDIILLYEKECSKYEESASVVYEKLIDMGYKNVYYILNKDNQALHNMNEKYKKNIIYKDSLKHITYFFKTKKIIATESMDHALQLRIANRYVMNKLQDKQMSYVFLQHGVMYMVSLSSDLRTGFKKMPIKLHKIVTSSELEAKHFTDLGGFERKDLYVCGLPKFDTAVRHKNADKIIIMPTWRRWEANQASINYEETKYYKMIQRIVKTIPKKLKDKVIILPHPLMLKEIKNNKEYQNYIPEGEFTYDELLKDCKLLITDYSSIAYDAYYRGSNVIFYWEEKEECMEQYGANTILMLNEKNVFADVCYNTKELAKVIEDNYNNPQTKNNQKKYRKIVEFSDNKNTERLIEMLINDGVIKKI